MSGDASVRVDYRLGCMIQIDIPAFKKTPIPAFAPLNAKKSGYRDSVLIDGADSLHAESCVDVRELGLRASIIIIRRSIRHIMNVCRALFPSSI